MTPQNPFAQATPAAPAISPAPAITPAFGGITPAPTESALIPTPAITPAFGGITPAPTESALVPAVPAIGEQPAATAPTTAPVAGIAGFANPFADLFRQRQAPAQPGVTGIATPAKPKYEPPHELVFQLRKAIAEQRYSDVKSLADQYKVVDPQSGLADFFVNLSRIREDTITERNELGGLILAQYGAQRSVATKPAKSESSVGVATPSGTTASPTPFDVAQAPGQPTPATGMIAQTLPSAIVTPAQTEAPTVAPVAPVVTFEEEPLWKKYAVPAAIGLAVLVLVFVAIALIRKRKARAALAPVEEAPAPSVPVAAATVAGIGAATPSPPSDGFDFESAFGSTDVAPADVAPPTVETVVPQSPAAEDPFATLDFNEPVEQDLAPSAGEQMPSELEDTFMQSESVGLEISEPLGMQDLSDDAFQSAHPEEEDQVADLLNFIPSENLDETLQSGFDIGAIEAQSEAPSRDDMPSSLNFEDLVTARTSPSRLPDDSKETGSAFSLNDFESIGEHSVAGEESGGSLSFDDLVISKPPMMTGDESLSVLDLENMDFPSLPPSEIDDSFISDYDEVSDMGSDVEQTKGFQAQFENLLFGATPPPPPVFSETTHGVGDADSSETTETADSTKRTGELSPDDTQPSDLGPELETAADQTAKSEQRTTADLSSEDTNFNLDTQADTKPDEKK